MFNQSRRGMLCVTVSLFLVGIASAATSQTISYQGRLTDAVGDPVADNPYLVKFIVYDASVAGASGGRLRRGPQHRHRAWTRGGVVGGG